MNRRRIFPLASLLATVLLCSPGCAIVRGWWMKSSTPPVKKADETVADEKKTATPAELAAIMAEVQQLGALDPAAQMRCLRISNEPIRHCGRNWCKRSARRSPIVGKWKSGLGSREGKIHNRAWRLTALKHYRARPMAP